jgi:hypothetical protein
VSAQEIIEQIKALPPEEKAKVAEFVHVLERAELKESSGDVHYVDRATLESSAEQIFDRYDDLFRKLAK